jgi:hypothetical protein
VEGSKLSTTCDGFAADIETPAAKQAIQYSEHQSPVSIEDNGHSAISWFAQRVN